MLKRILVFIKKCLSVKKTQHADDMTTVDENIKNAVMFLKSRRSKNRSEAVENTIALRYCQRLRKTIEYMRKTTELQRFTNLYNDALILANAVLSFEHIDKRVRSDMDRIAVALEDMKRENTDFDEKEIVCYSVVFGFYRKEYFYLSHKGRYRIGQYVRVPVGDDMIVRIAKIVGVRPADECVSPVPLPELKAIMGNGV